MSAEKLAEALRLMLRQFTKTPSTLKDTQARAEAHRALAAYEAEAKAAPTDWVLVPVEPTDAMFRAADKADEAAYVGGADHGATASAIWDAMLAAATVKESLTPAPLTDEQVAAALEAGGIGVQRFMGGISGTKDCWSTQGSADIRKVAAVVRGLIANGAKP